MRRRRSFGDDVPDWVKRTPAEPGPPVVDVPSGLAMPLLIGFGIIGGFAIGIEAVKHLRVEGLTDKERKGMLLLAGGAVGAYGLAYLFDIDKKWLDAMAAAEAGYEHLFGKGSK